MKIISVVGARPQFVKAAALSMAIRASAHLEEKILHTGQHYDFEMSEVFLKELGIGRPAYRLDVGSGSHAEQTASALVGVERILVSERPDMVVVFGDTNSTLAGALAAAKVKIPLAHVEAGMRSFDRTTPEEVNRIVTDHLATLHFCASRTAVRNLEAEGIREGVYLVGDIMADCVRIFGDIAESKVSVKERFGLEPKGFALATCHRAENTDDRCRLEGIMQGLSLVARHLPVVCPAHPRLVRAIKASGMTFPKGALVIPPVGYIEMLALERQAAVIITDSGGVQKEALYARVPCVTLRNETEWVETVEAGWNTLAGTDPDRIEQAVLWALAKDVKAMGDPSGIYGDGHAAERIVEVLETYTRSWA